MKSENTRDQIVSSAKTLLWDIGFESMSPRKVLYASGAGQGSLYHHFSGKEDLASAALAEISRDLRHEFDRLLEEATSPLEAIELYLGKNRNGVKGCRLGRLANEKSVHETGLRTPLADYFAYVGTRLSGLVKQAQQQSLLKPSLNAEELAAMLISVIQGGYILSRIHQSPKHLTNAQNGALALLENASLEKSKEKK